MRPRFSSPSYRNQSPSMAESILGTANSCTLSNSNVKAGVFGPFVIFESCGVIWILAWLSTWYIQYSRGKSSDFCVRTEVHTGKPATVPQLDTRNISKATVVPPFKRFLSMHHASDLVTYICNCYVLLGIPC